MKTFVFLFFFCSTLFLSAAPAERNPSMPPSEMRRRLVNAAAKYENTPYVYGGMTKAGLDCSGFISLSFMDALGITPPRSAAAQYNWTQRIPLEEAIAGDLLFFKTDNSGRITHVGLYLGNGRFIHSASAGAKTGVIYSGLSEPYWSRAFAGAGRVLPVDSSGIKTGNSRDSKSSLSFAFGIAPTWNLIPGENLFRGFTSHLHVGFNMDFLGINPVLGMELRPEYDGLLGVFRLPLTLSIELGGLLSVYAGPVLSFGSPSLYINGSERLYNGGTSWLGSAGIMVTPVTQRTKIGDFSPFIDFSWQYYQPEADEKNKFADFITSTRLSTGLRWGF